MAFWLYTGSVAEFYPAFNLNAVPGKVYDLGAAVPPAEPIPKEGQPNPGPTSRWSSSAGPATDGPIHQITDAPGGSGITQAAADQRYPVVALPTPYLLQDFTAAANTTASSTIAAAGTPAVGAWTAVTGGALATMQIVSGQLVSPGGDTYVIANLGNGNVPGRVRQRFILTSGIGSATIGIVNGTTLSLPSVNMVHVTITANFISLTVWTAGASNIPVNNGNPTNGAMALSQNVEYMLEVFVEGNTLHSTVSDLAGNLMGVYDGGDAGLSALMGQTIFIEPTSGGVITYVDAYPAQQVKVA